MSESVFQGVIDLKFVDSVTLTRLEVSGSGNKLLITCLWWLGELKPNVLQETVAATSSVKPSV